VSGKAKWKSWEVTSMTKLRSTILLAVFFVAPFLRADDILYQTALMGNSEPPNGVTLTDVQFLGARFTLSSPAHITSLGGEFFNVVDPTTPRLFGALVSLPNADALPSNTPGVPFSASPLLTFTFDAPFLHNADVLVPVDLTLPGGAYALVFGTGLFGTAAGHVGGMPDVGDGNTILPGADLIEWFDQKTVGQFANATWRVGTNNGQRFVVKGTAVPEPSSIFLFAGSLMGVALCTRRFRHRLSRD
jgi:hypothetical protein